MEKDRALNLLQNGLLPVVHGAYHDALKMAIEALKMEPCKDAINVQQAIDAVCRWGVNNERNGKLMITMAEAKQSIVDLLDDLPSVQPEQKMGRWIESHIPESTLCECSVCGFSCGAYSFNFCPACGAKMEGGE